jgi:amino acid transporter
LPVIWSGIPSSLPFVLYAAMGFEAICAISNKIEDAERNGPKAIMISFTTMMILVFLFQFLLYATLGQTLTDQPNYLGAFPALLQKLFPSNPALIHKLQALFHLAIASSALGGCYGILYSNNWNLHILAQNKKIRGWQILTLLNRQAIPYVCLFVEWIFCIGYLIFSSGNQIILQQLAALGTALTYTICVIALMLAYKRTHVSSPQKLIPFAALFSCFILIGAGIRNFAIGGILPLLGVFGLLCFGLLMYKSK